MDRIRFLWGAGISQGAAEQAGTIEELAAAISVISAQVKQTAQEDTIDTPVNGITVGIAAPQRSIDCLALIIALLCY